MKDIRTTETFVRKLKERAKERAITEGISVSRAQEVEAQVAGYESFHHVIVMLNRWRDRPAPPDANEFSTMKHPGQAIIDWLNRNHAHALQQAWGRMLAEVSDDNFNPADALSYPQIESSLFEFFTAECFLSLPDGERRVAQVILDGMGDQLDTTQRRYLQELMATPLLLYVVSRVDPGVSITLVDEVDPNAKPITVPTDKLSQEQFCGIQLGLRILQRNSRPHWSGAYWPFPPGMNGARDAAATGTSASIIRQCLKVSFGKKRVHGQVTHAKTGEPIYLVTRYYEVKDITATLERICRSKQAEQVGAMNFNFGEGVGKDRLNIGHINIDPRSRHLELFSETKTLAARAHSWLEAVAGDAIRFAHSKEEDPVALLNEASDQELAAIGERAKSEIQPDLQSQIFQTFLHKHYANFLDDPIPALNYQTPRQACKTKAGKEQVRALLEMYETNERRMAEQMGRPQVSYDFLWEMVELQR
ncbi:MAG: DUF2384 domain-containing protein [Anaerolineae bacterium]|nr:DUF2384 domain-containing protein [Anaerolineae bacterium]